MLPPIVMLTLLGACQSEPKAPAGSAPALDQIPATVPDTPASSWLSEYWTLPVPAQGPAPEDWTALEASLDPESCGTCHPQQLADWQQSLHHLGMGPGVMGQLVDWDGSDDRTVGMCQACHAPLTEQLPRTRDGDAAVENPSYDASMRSKGLTCAGCHVRHNQRLGPPKEGRPTDAEGVALADGPHGGFVPKEEFQSADFCSTCHDFKKSQLALKGKLLQETGPEWRRTDFAAQGVTCQTCHMPDRRHLWKGIHDPEIVAKGVEITGGIDDVGGLLTPVRASLSLANVWTGHRLPTYTTPVIKLIIVQLDAQGEPLPDTQRQAAIGRRITPNLRQELHDTRLLPGESLTLPYATRRRFAASALQARVEVWPDEAYRRFYDIKLRHPEQHPQGQAQLRQALQHSIDSRYVLWQESWTL